MAVKVAADGDELAVVLDVQALADGDELAGEGGQRDRRRG